LYPLKEGKSQWGVQCGVLCLCYLSKCKSSRAVVRYCHQYVFPALNALRSQTVHKQTVLVKWPLKHDLFKVECTIRKTSISSLVFTLTFSFVRELRFVKERKYAFLFFTRSDRQVRPANHNQINWINNDHALL